MESSVSSTGKKRPRRSCVEVARKIKKEQAKEQLDNYILLFQEIVYSHFLYMFYLLYDIKNDPTNLSFQRKYDEVLSELYSFCAQWKNLIELNTIQFVSLNGVKTSIVYFNYEKPKEFVGQECMKKVSDEIKNFEDNGRTLKEHVRRTVVDRNSDLIEAFGCALGKNIMQKRQKAYIENKVDPLHIKNFPTVRFTKKMNEGNCNICLGDFKTNEKLFRMKCGNLLHCNCLREWLKKSNFCPFCKEILS